MDCALVETVLSAYEKGDLASGEREAVAAHLSSCPACRAALDDFAALTALAVAEAASVPPALGAASSASGAPSTSPAPAERLLEAIKAEVAAEAALATVEHEIMTFDEVAAYLRVAPDELEAELSTLPFFELGGRLRIRRSRLVAWVEEREGRARHGRLHLLARG
jgi:anti-sigma factor RsiW